MSTIGSGDDGCLAGWCADDDWCAITCAADVLGRKWHPVIVNRLLDGPRGFAELDGEIDGLSQAVLSESLEDLETKGILTRDIVNEKPFRVEYALTDRGRAFAPVIDAMVEWGRRELAAAGRGNRSG